MFQPVLFTAVLSCDAPIAAQDAHPKHLQGIENYVD